MKTARQLVIFLRKVAINAGMLVAYFFISLDSTVTIDNEKVFISAHQLPSAIQNKLTQSFLQASITTSDMGTKTLGNKLAKTGFGLIKGLDTIIAKTPPCIGPFILKAEGRLKKINALSQENILRIALAVFIEIADFLLSLIHI